MQSAKVGRGVRVGEEASKSIRDAKIRQEQKMAPHADRRRDAAA